MSRKHGDVIDNVRIELTPAHKQREPHRCPVCDGAGVVSRPPHVPGDVATWAASDITTYECPACGGACVLWGVAMTTPGASGAKGHANGSTMAARQRFARGVGLIA